MSLPKIVALCGRKGSGKDTAAVPLFEKGYTEVKFAGCLKEMLRTYLSYRGLEPLHIERIIEGDLKEVELGIFHGNTFRLAAQTLGTEWGRCAISKNIWVDATVDRMKQFDKVVITDLRFENEIEKIRELGGKIIRINRPSLRNGAGSDHSSEMAIDLLQADAEVINDSTMSKLQFNLIQVLKEI